MEKNMTQGKEWKSILFFALPVAGSYLLQILYNISDSIIVGNFIGPDALGAVGLTSAMTWFLVNFCVGLGSGTNIVISQFYGAGKKEQIKKSVGASLILAVFAALFLTTVCFLAAGPLIERFLQTPPEMSGQSKAYFCIYSVGLIFQFVYNAAYGILRAHGDSRGSLLFLLVSSVMNIVLDLLLVAGLHMGVAGAAAATVISQAASAIASLLYMRKYFPHLWPDREFFTNCRKEASLVIRLSVPLILQSCITAGGFIILQRLVNTFGPASIQGYAALQKVEQIAYIPCDAIYVAMGSFVGQNIGARRLDRVERGYNASLKIGLGSTVILAAVVMVFATPVLRMFNISGDALIRGREHLYILMVCSVLNCVYKITSGLLQGAGDVKPPAVAGFTNLLVRVGSAYLMAGTFIDFRSVYISIPFSWGAACAVTYFRYRSGKWKSYHIV